MLTKRSILFLVLSLFSMGCTSQATSEECDGCWSPKLNFDIEGKGFISSLLFISGQSYALTMNNRELQSQGKQNFFCKEGDIGSRLLIEILNAEFEGSVGADKATSEIAKGLKNQFPCTGL
jgi:hypothetical protein